MLLIQTINPKRVRIGGTVVVYGVGFDYRCWARIGSRYLNVLDYDDDSLEFSAPSDTGFYSLEIGQNSTVYATFDLSVVSLRESNTWCLPDRNEDDFRHALIGLMPRGFAWFLGRGGNWWKLFSALASVICVVYNEFVKLVVNASPAKTTAYTDWERELALPVKGLEQDSNDGRLSEIYRVSRLKTGDTVPCYRALAALFGRDAKVYEYWKNPEKFSGVDFGDDDPNFYWMVEQTSSDDEWHVLDCNDTCNDFLGRWWNPVLESFFELIKPAHTKVIYTYKLPEVVYIMTEDGDYIMTENGDFIVTENGMMT